MQFPTDSLSADADNDATITVLYVFVCVCRFVSVSDLMEPTDDGAGSKVNRHLSFDCCSSLIVGHLPREGET